MIGQPTAGLILVFRETAYTQNIPVYTRAELNRLPSLTVSDWIAYTNTAASEDAPDTSGPIRLSGKIKVAEYQKGRDSVVSGQISAQVSDGPWQGSWIFRFHIRIWWWAIGANYSHSALENRVQDALTKLVTNYIIRNVPQSNV